MDKIWDRHPSKSEVIGRCGGDEKKTRRTDKSRTLKNNNKLTNENIYIFKLTNESLYTFLLTNENLYIFKLNNLSM